MNRKKYEREIRFDEIPAGIVSHDHYTDGEDRYMSKAKMTLDGLFVAIWFEDGSSDLWQRTKDGWLLRTEANRDVPIRV